MNKAGFAIVAIAVLISTQLQADVVGFQIGTSSWTPDYKGTFSLSGSTPGTVVDIQDDLGFSDESHSDIWVKLEHPVPILPNIRFASSDLDASANSTLTRDIVFGDETFSEGSDVSSRFDMSNTELTLYYELLDNWISFDAGLTLRQYDGQVQISTSTTSAGENLDFPVPLLYLDARIDLPVTGLFIDSTMNAASIDNNSISDINVSLGYETDFGLGARVGYRTLELTFDESDVEADLEFEGTYLNLFYHF